MFLPYFIAILLGFINPSNKNHSCANGTTVSINATNPDDPNDPGTTPPGDDTGGETGHTPIRN